MVDAATQDRLFPSGYRQIDSRSARTSSASTKRKTLISFDLYGDGRPNSELNFVESRRKALNFVEDFHRQISSNRDTVR